MKTRFLVMSFVAAGLLSAAPFAAQAQSSRLYFAGYMGLNMNTESAFEETATPARGDMKYDHAPSFAGALGLRLTENWRVEGEISYRKSDFDAVDFAGGGTFDLGGDMGTWLYMLNAYYDFDFEWERIQPYVTAGVGVAHHSGAIRDASGLAASASDSAIGFAWQAGGGLKYRVNQDLALTGGYRYVGTSDVQFDNYDFSYGSHEWRFGLEYDIPVDLFK